MHARPRPLRLTAATLVVVPLLAAGLAGCTSAVGVEPAPRGADPLCAQVYAALPDSIAGLQRRETTAQGAAAWTGVPSGSEDGAEVTVVLRCGVEQLDALQTADGCQHVEDDGVSVDWIPRDDADGRTTWTTYGREPAVSVQMPADLALTVVPAVGKAVAVIEQSARCS